MDFLDSNKDNRQRISLMLGYILVTIAIVIATIVLVYQAYGFNINGKGSVIQNGLIFLSSNPNPAKITFNNGKSNQQTNSRLSLPSGIYRVSLSRTGYRDWNRTITVNGGSVEHFDYPFLFPTTLTSQRLNTYTSAPEIETQSPNRNWLLIDKPGSMTDFDLWNLQNTKKPVLESLSLPSNLLTKATTSESWKFISWSDDNKHILLEHLYDGKSEYIVVDRTDPTQSVNLNTTFNVDPVSVTLNNDKYDSYYFMEADGDLETANIGDAPTVTTVLQHVLSYKSYGNNTILYATDTDAPAGKVVVDLKSGSHVDQLLDLPANTNYLLDLTTYNGTLYVAVGDTLDSKVYVYANPANQLSNYPGQPIVTSWVLHVNQPNYISFSNNAQFIMIENNNSYAVYDIQNNVGYFYSDPNLELDSPQMNATWMDGDRLTYVSDGKLEVQDYDNTNKQSLVAASSQYLPAFASNYDYLYTMSQDAAGQYVLYQTPLLTPTDLP